MKRRTKPDPLPREFAVRDDKGNLWPPGFRSRLGDPMDALCIIPHAKLVAAKANLKRAIEASASSEEGWGTGHLPGIGKLPSHIKLRARPARKVKEAA